MTVIAEGEETSAQRDALIQLSCKRFQRNLFGKTKLIDEKMTK